MIRLELAVGIPAVVINLDKADSLFHQPPGYQALLTDARRGCIIQPVQFPRGRRLLSEIDHRWYRRLHAKCQLV